MNLKTQALSSLYKPCKKILFLQDPEKVHDKFISFGEKLGSKNSARKLVSSLFNYQNKKLEQSFFNIKFKNPIGLAAGFDYEGKLTQILPNLGFGFQTIGSVTFEPYEGNAKPRLTRLIKSRSLLVNKGLKNTGSSNIIKEFKKLKFRIPLGVSIAKTNSEKTASDKDGIKDYLSSFNLWENSSIPSFYELNISCPNSFGGEPFTEPKKLSSLLIEIDKLRIKKPLFIKMPVDLSEKQTLALLKVIDKHSVNGLIFGNLTKDRSNNLIDKSDLQKIKSLKGGLSGNPTSELSNKLISLTYKKYSSRFLIIGCGGIFSAEDAYEKIKLGSSLVQLITGMIYKGPSLIGEINQGIVRLLKKDGFENISEAIGSAHN